MRAETALFYQNINAIRVDSLNSSEVGESKSRAPIRFRKLESRKRRVCWEGDSFPSLRALPNRSFQGTTPFLFAFYMNYYMFPVCCFDLNGLSGAIGCQGKAIGF